MNVARTVGKLRSKIELFKNGGVCFIHRQSPFTISAWIYFNGIHDPQKHLSCKLTVQKLQACTISIVFFLDASASTSSNLDAIFSLFGVWVFVYFRSVYTFLVSFGLWVRMFSLSRLWVCEYFSLSFFFHMSVNGIVETDNQTLISYWTLTLTAFITRRHRSRLSRYYARTHHRQLWIGPISA